MVRRAVEVHTRPPRAGAVHLEDHLVQNAFLSIGKTDPLHQQFLTLMAKIETHARIVFRAIRCPVRKEDAVQDCIALAWKWFLRLQERGRDINQFPMVFVFLVVKAVASGRRLTGMLRVKDVLSERCQRKHGFNVEALPTSTRISVEVLVAKPRGQEMQDAFEERLQDNGTTPVPDQVAFRIDWPSFFTTLPTRDQRMAEFLPLGHNAKQAAEKFGLSAGRITQLRQRWCKEWLCFQNEPALA